MPARPSAFAADGLDLGNAIVFAQAGDPIIDTGSNTITLSGAISGPGDLSKIGTGTLDLTGTDTYTGPTDVVGGTLLVDGSITSAATVETGATLGGHGSIGGLVALSGSTVAPGAAVPFSTLSVGGDVSFQAGSTYRVQVDASGRTDRIAASGTATLGGGTVDVQAGAGSYGLSTRYTILTAAGGVTGQFSGLTTTSNLAFLDPALSYDADDVVLGFTRKADFVAAAGTPNQRAAGGGAAEPGIGGAVRCGSVAIGGGGAAGF